MEPATYQQFNADEERELFHRMKAGDTEARRLLIESQIAWVRKLTHEFCKRSGWRDFEDAESIAIVHLVNVVDNKFDPDRGRLSTLMGWATRHKLIREKNRDRLIQLPSQLSDNEQLREQAEASYVLTSIHADSEAHRAIIEETYDRPAMYHDSDEALHRKKLKGAIKRLERRQRHILRMRMKGWTLKQVGTVFGISKERVRQIELKAVDKLRKSVLRVKV